jgi:hypothetical protein
MTYVKIPSFDILSASAISPSVSVYETDITYRSSPVVIDGSGNKVTINAPLVVNGRDILGEIDDMRDVLLLLRRDIDMEYKYPRLKELKDEYERELEKYRTFERLK